MWAACGHPTRGCTRAPISRWVCILVQVHVLWCCVRCMRRLAHPHPFLPAPPPKQVFTENGRSLDDTVYLNPEHDPFYDAPEDQHLGRSTVYLNVLMHFMPMDAWTPIFDFKVCRVQAWGGGV